MTEKSRIALAEGIGTLILVVGGPGHRGARDRRLLPTGSVGVLGVALAFGLSLLCAAYAIGSISGCHINPAVTVGLWALGKTKSGDVPFYIGGQVVGGLVGAAIIFVIADSHAGLQREGQRLRVERLRRALAGRLQAARGDPHRDRVHRAVRLRDREHEPQVDVAGLHRHHRRAHAHA